MEIYTPLENSNGISSTYYIVGFLVLLIIGGIVAYFMYKKKNNNDTPTPTPTSTPNPDEQLRKVLRSLSKDNTTMRSSRTFREGTITGNTQLIKFIDGLKSSGIIPENCSAENVFQNFYDCKYHKLALNNYDKNKDSNLFLYAYIVVLLILFGVDTGVPYDNNEDIKKFISDNSIKLNISDGKEIAKVIYDDKDNKLNIYLSKLIIRKKALDIGNQEIIKKTDDPGNKEDIAVYIYNNSELKKDGDGYDYLQVDLNDFNQKFKPEFTKKTFDENPDNKDLSKCNITSEDTIKTIFKC